LKGAEIRGRGSIHLDMRKRLRRGYWQAHSIRQVVEEEILHHDDITR
jgi:hypothetical protein